MTWEALGAISVAFTAIVITVTAIASFRQLVELRLATQFEGSLEVFKELDSREQTDARRFVIFELPRLMQDPDYRTEVALLGLSDERVHQELTVLRCFERVGAYAKKGFIDRDVVYMVAAGRIVSMWHALGPVIEIHRSVAGPIWSNFEELYNVSNAWRARQGVVTADLERRQREIIASGSLAVDRPEVVVPPAMP